MTFNPFQSEQHFSLDWPDPFEQEPVFESTLHHSPELSEFSRCIESSHVSSVSMCDIEAASEGPTYKEPIIKMIEVKQVSDELKVSYTGDTLSLERAFQCGLIPVSVYEKILQRQTTCQDAAEDVPLFESVQEVEICEVNRLVLECLGRKKSLTSERDIHTLRSFHGVDQEALLNMLGAQMDVGDPDEVQYVNLDEDAMSGIEDMLTVDAAVQCDLMSSSSALTVLGNKQQFIGLVLPSSGEIQTVAPSFQDDQSITTNAFTSSLVSNQDKITAFYIPEFSEVIDVCAAVQRHLIDNDIAQVLESLEIPDVCPDVDHLQEKFSSWLMYKKLIVDGCFHAADCLKVDHIPSDKEAKQLLISYLMINSYIDPKTGKRVLILDKQMSKMMKIFLEDSTMSENSEKNVTSLNLNVGARSEEVGLDILLHINEGTEEMMRYPQQTSDNFVSSFNGTITFNEKTHANEKAINQHPDMEVSGDDDMDLERSDLDTAEETMCHKHTNWAQSGDYVERIYGNNLKIDDEGLDNEAFDIPNVSEASGCLSEGFVSECSGKPRQQTLPYFDPGPLCSESEGTDVIEAESLCSEDFREGDFEQDYVSHLLKAQMEEGNILDVPPEIRSELEAALCKGLVDERMVLKLLDSHSYDKQSKAGDEEGMMSALKQTMSDGFTSSNLAISIMEQLSHSRSACTIPISEPLQSGLVTDDADRILNWDPEASICPEKDCNHSISDDHHPHLININEAENTQLLNERKVTAMRPDLNDEEARKREIESEIRGSVVDYDSTGNAEEMNTYLHYHPSGGGLDSVMCSSSLFSQVTAECDHHSDKACLLEEGSDSPGVISQQLTDSTAASCLGRENAAPTTQSGPADDRANVESHTNSMTHAKSASSSLVDDFLNAAIDAELGNQPASETEFDMASFPQSALSEENTMTSHTSARHSPLHSEPTPNLDYSSAKVENPIISSSWDNGSHDNNITEDGNRVTSHLQAALYSDSKFSIGPEPGHGLLVGERFPESHIASEEITATNGTTPRCVDVGDSERHTQATTRVSDEAVLVDQNLSGSLDYFERGTGHLSPERQHGDVYKITEDIEPASVSRRAQPAEANDEQQVDTDVPGLEISSERIDTGMGAGLGGENRVHGSSEHPQNVSELPHNVCEHPYDASEYPSDVSEHPHYAPEHSNNASEHPCDASEHPHKATEYSSDETECCSDASEHPRDASEHPHNAPKYPNDISKYPHDVSGHVYYAPGHPQIVSEHPNDASGHPSYAPEYPNDISNYLDDTFKYPHDAPEPPCASSEHHHDVSEHLVDTAEYPNGVSKHPLDSPEHPCASSELLIEYPNDASEYHHDVFEHPSKTSEHPKETAEYPNEVSEHPHDVSEHPEVVSCKTDQSDFLSDHRVRFEVSSSAPSVVSDPVVTSLDHQREIPEVVNVSDLQKVQDVESPVSIVPISQQPLEEGSYHEGGTPHSHIESAHPDVLMDLLKQNALRHNREGRNLELIQQNDQVSERKEESDTPSIQLQLLQVLQTVSSSQDISMLQEVMESLNMALGGESQEEQRHMLESIKEESSEEGDGELADDNFCHSAENNPQLSTNLDGCKVEQIKYKVCFMLLQC